MDNFNLIDLDKVLDEFEKTEEDVPAAKDVASSAASTWPRGAEKAVPVTSQSASHVSSTGLRPSSLKVQGPQGLAGQRVATCVSNSELHLPDDQTSVSSSGYDSLRTSSEFIVSSQEYVAGVGAFASAANLAACAVPEEITPTVEREDTFDSFRDASRSAETEAVEEEEEEEVEEEEEEEAQEEVEEELLFASRAPELQEQQPVVEPKEYQAKLPAVALDNCAAKPDLVHASASSVDLVPPQPSSDASVPQLSDPVVSFGNLEAISIPEMDESEMNAYLGLEAREEPEGIEETLPDIAASCGSLPAFAGPEEGSDKTDAPEATSEPPTVPQPKSNDVSPPDIVDLERAFGQPDLIRPESSSDAPSEDYPCSMDLPRAESPLAVVNFAPEQQQQQRPSSLVVVTSPEQQNPGRGGDPGLLSPGSAEKRRSLVPSCASAAPATDVPKKRVRPNTLLGLTKPTAPSEAIRLGRSDEERRASPNENPLYFMDRNRSDAEDAVPKPRRPNWLALPTRSMSTDSGGGTTSSTLTPGLPGSHASPMSEGPATPVLAEPVTEPPPLPPEAAAAEEEMDTTPATRPRPESPPTLEPSAPPSAPSCGGPEPTPFSHDLGRVAPIWVHDRDAPACMGCAARFTLTRRRHHCRACGKVFCHMCCSHKAKMHFLDGKEARVCAVCFQHLIRLESCANRNDPATLPSAATLPDDLPTSALRGSRRRSAGGRTVVFADGIRPGGDLTEAESSVRVATPSRPTAPGPVPGDFPAATTASGPPYEDDEFCFLNGLAADAVLPIVTAVCPELQLEVEPDVVEVASQFSLADDLEASESAIRFALTRHLHVLSARVRLSCCVGMECWVVSTRGLAAYGQAEIVIVLQCLPDELLPPLDLFRYLYGLYTTVKKGENFCELSCHLTETPFLGDKENAGFVFIRPTYQCLEQISLPSGTQFLIGVLIQRWEAPLAKLFPLRLILRLGHYYRYYPCPIFSCRNRGPVYEMPGITLLQLLVDFRNFSYTIPAIPGLRVHLSPGGLTRVILPKASYPAVMRAISGIDSNVLALGAAFSTEADSHLVCVQSDVEEGSYTTQAISVHNRFRQVTGASFLILNGGMRQSKSSIVEDGVMVHVTSQQMTDCLNSLKAMREFTLVCNRCAADTGEAEVANDEVHFTWTEEGMAPGMALASQRPISWIDGLGLDEPGCSEYRAPVGLRACASAGDLRLLWSRLFVLRAPCPEAGEPVDPLQLGREVAAAVGKALSPHLSKLFTRSESARAIALRVSLTAEALIDFDLAGRTPDLTGWVQAVCGPDLDAQLVPLLIQHSSGGPAVVELEFHVVE